MAKHRTTKRKKGTRSKQDASKAMLPAGFWQQVGAIALVAFALLLVVAWFGAGGPVLEWANDTILKLVGYTLYVLPALFIFLAVEVFRSADNRVASLTKFTSLLLILWLSGLFGLYTDAHGATTGGSLGDLINRATLSLVSHGVAAFVYVLLVLLTLLAVLRVSPRVILDFIIRLTKTRERTEQEENKAIMKQAAKQPAKISDDFKLNAGVPTMHSDDKKSAAKPVAPAHEKASEQTALVMAADPNWQAPSLKLLERNENPADAGDIERNAAIIRDTLSEFNIDVRMEGANIGPKVTQYTLQPSSGVKLAKITALENNLSLNLAAKSLRIEAPIPGKRAVGVEVPNVRAADVRLRGMLESKDWNTSHEPLSFAVGRDISGEPIIGELNKMPHLLVAGQTNSGKSVMINSLICSLLYRNSPAHMKLILVDPKQVEMARYKDIPHLLTPIITDPEKTISALKWAVNEMERRYKLLSEVGELNIQDYNDSINTARKRIAVQDDSGVEQKAEEGAMPYIVVIIDEMADLMMVARRDVEALVARLAAKARAVGIHLVLATQSPRADVVTGLIKANIPAKIAFTVGNQVESRIILDQVGAEKLLGQGDMLYKTATMGKPIRIQGAWVTNKEVKKIASYLREQAPPQYNDEIVSQPVQLNVRGGLSSSVSDGGDNDEMFRDAVRIVTENHRASTTLLQLHLKVGYARAARIMAEMEEQGIIGPANGSKPRDVLISSVDELDGASEEE